MLSIGIITPIIDNGNATFSLIVLPLGIYLMITKEKITDFDEKTRNEKYYE